MRRSEGQERHGGDEAGGLRVAKAVRWPWIRVLLNSWLRGEVTALHTKAKPGLASPASGVTAVRHTGGGGHAVKPL